MMGLEWLVGMAAVLLVGGALALGHAIMDERDRKDARR
jgi:hypothetical protein